MASNYKDSDLVCFSRPMLKMAFTVEYEIDGGVCTVNINDYIANLPTGDRIKVLRELANVIDEAYGDLSDDHLFGVLQSKEAKTT